MRNQSNKVGMEKKKREKRNDPVKFCVFRW